MVPIVFNTAAVAAAKSCKDTLYREYFWVPCKSEPKRTLIGKVTIKSDNVSISHTLDSKGYEIMFKDVRDITDLIDGLTKLRNSFFQKGD